MALNMDAYSIIKNAQESTGMVQITDLVAIGNIDKQNGDINTTVVSDNNTYITVSGLHSDSFINRYVVVGREICKITSITRLTTTSNIYVDRAQYGTLDSYANRLLDDCAIEQYYSFRTVTLFDNVNSFSTNSLGLNTSDIFGLNLETNAIELSVENFKDWDITNTSAKYWFRSRGTIIYVFRGLDGQRALVYTGFGKDTNESRSREESKINISYNDKFALWFNKDMDVVAEFNNTYPRAFFSTLLGIQPSMVKYDCGLIETDFKTVSRVYSKEFKTYKDMLIQYAQHGFRFYFDELERLHVFQEFEPSKLTVTHEIPINETNINDIRRSSDNRLIRNKITTTYKDRQPMFDYVNDLQSKHKLFRYSLAVTGFTVLAGNGEFNVLSVDSADLMAKTQIDDYVLLEDNLLGTNFYGRILNKNGNISEIVLGRFQKDYKTIPFGKYSYLTGLGFNLSRNFTLSYSIAELPVVSALTINYESGERDEALMYPLLPQVVGQTENIKKWNATLGSVENLSLGKYSGFTTNIEGCYGSWDNTKLFYDREKVQFNGVNPPIYVLSNKITTPRGNQGTSIIGYDVYDNSNLQMVVSKPTGNGDMDWTFKNTISIPESSLQTLTPTARMSNILIKVDSIVGWNVGDVLMIQPLPNMSIADRNTYSQVKNIRYVVEGFITESGLFYVIISDNYPRASMVGTIFPCVRYPFDSIVYLQEVFIKGNPIIEEEQTISHINQTSIDYYDTVEYPLTGIFYSSDDIKDFMAYIFDGYGAIRSDGLDRKLSFPIKIRDKYNVTKGDIIRVRDNLITGIQPTQLYYVLGVQHSSRDPYTTLNIVNLNPNDADGSDIEFDSKLTYFPIVETYYSYNGETGTDVGKKTVQDTDADFGQMQINRIDRANFRANILSVVDNKITFDTFEGTEESKYRELFFGKVDKSEFVVMLNNEFVYMKSYDDLNANTDSATIIKRELFKSALSDLNQPQTVTFYTIASGVSTDGKLVSHNLYVGTDTDHLKFAPLLGLEVKSKGEIDLSNDNNRVYLDPSLVDNKSQILLSVGTVVGKEDVDFQVGETTGSYLKFDENGLAMNVKDLSIDGEGVQKLFNKIKLPVLFSTTKTSNPLSISVNGIIYTVDSSQYILKDFSIWGANHATHSFNNEIIGLCSDGTYIYSAYVIYSSNNYNLYVNRHTIADSAIAYPTLIKSYTPYQSTGVNILPNDFEMFICATNGIIMQGYSGEIDGVHWFCEELNKSTFVSTTLYYENVSTDTSMRYYIINNTDNYYSNLIFPSPAYYYLQSGTLYRKYTSPPYSTGIILENLLSYSKIKISNNTLFLYKTSSKLIYDISGVTPVSILDYTVQEFNEFVGKTLNYYYFKFLSGVYRSLDFNTFEKIYTGTYYTSYGMFGQTNDILEFSYNSYNDTMESNKVIGYSYGSSTL